tara:strand:- start:62 stop:442 length:381 start_codon:yes stop_codon:yes gene_type:complete
MKKPDNVVYNYEDLEYDAYKKPYPTSFTSKRFIPEKIKDFRPESQHYFKTKFFEIKNRYESLIEEIKWSEEINNSHFNFNPIIGETYYLYKGSKNNFLSILNPKEWDFESLGAYKFNSNKTWTKIN